MTAGAARGRLRACHADREQVIGALQTAFAQGRLTSDELDARADLALGARTYADLDALTADIPADPAAARLACPPGPAHRWPMARAAVKAGICLIIAAAAAWVASIADPAPGDSPHTNHSLAGLMFGVFNIAVFAALGFLAYGVVTSWKLRRSRRQLPPRPGPGPGGHALEGEPRASTGHDPVLPGLRTDQTRADLRTHKSRQDRRHIPTRAGRAPRGVRPAPGAV